MKYTDITCSVKSHVRPITNKTNTKRQSTKIVGSGYLARYLNVNVLITVRNVDKVEFIKIIRLVF